MGMSMSRGREPGGGRRTHDKRGDGSEQPAAAHVWRVGAGGAQSHETGEAGSLTSGPEPQ
jgi:hypothetical protein